MGVLNMTWPTLDDVEMMGVMELRRNYRFLRNPETEEELASLTRIGERLQENGLMTLPIRADQTKDLPDVPRNEG